MISENRASELLYGARIFERNLERKKGKARLVKYVFTAFVRQGLIVPNQYWTPGVLSPMPIMGKYYNHYGKEFITPRELGRQSATRLIQELVMDNLGVCRFHRGWAEGMMPDIMDSLFQLKKEYLKSIKLTASRINSRNSSVFWESERNVDFVHSSLKKMHFEDGNSDKDLMLWLDRFESDKHAAALDFWYEIHKGIHETLREF